MQPFKLHLKTALLASAVALAVLLVALLLISTRVADQVRNEQKQLAQLQAENLAEHISLFPAEIDANDLQRLTNFVSGSRPNLLTVRVWKLQGEDFAEAAAAEDSLPPEKISAAAKNALRNGSASQTVNLQQTADDDYLFRVFAPVVIETKVDGAVEIVERLDTVSTVVSRYILNLSWIALATVLLMTAAFYLLFQNLVYQPLERLLSAMETAKAGNFSAEMSEKYRKDEFGLLAKNFNSMIGQIGEMTAERARQNEMLQEKIGAATFELQSQNEQLESANLELFRAARKMGEMERLAAVGQAAAQFAHEVGTPLNLISGHVQLLKGSLPVDSKDSERLRTITAQIERIERIVRETLDRTRFGKSEHAPVNLNQVLRKIFDAVEPALAESNVRLTTHLAENLPFVSGDAERLQQVFFNLIKNALDAMPSGGQLAVSTAVTQNKVVIEFADTGIGMNEETRAGIFQPLFTTKERGRGTGLGLVVVKQIVQEHAGEISVESESGGGSKFALYFPVELSNDEKNSRS